MAPMIPALTGIRLVAALLVMWGHGVAALFPGGLSPAAWNSLVGFANVGMSLFFVLSGFIITYTYGDITKAGWPGVKRFAIARVARIYPIYLAFLLLTVLLFGAAGVTPAGWLSHLTLTQAWFWRPSNGTPLIQQFAHADIAWSISAEWFCYLMFWPICILVWRARAPLAIAIMVWLGVLSFMALLFFNPPWPPKVVEWIGYYSPFIRIWEFIIGALLCRVALSLPPPSARERSLSALYVVAAAAWLLVALETFSTPGMTVLTKWRWCGGFTPAAGLLIFWAYRHGGSILAARWIEKAGDASYTFYLLHALILVAASHVGPPPSADAFAFAVRISAAIAFNLAVSLLIYRFFENPARRFIKGLRA